ncbi:MAG: MATE family efflux transporter [bacterium]|nr:MATE family efflux transporter [bacterium]
MSSRENPAPESAAPRSAGRARLEFRTLFGLSAPVAAAQLGMMTMGVIDTMMVARVGLDSLAAVAVASTWAWSSGSVAQGVVQGMDPLVSQAHGEGDGDAMGLALQRGLVVAFLVSIPLIALWLSTEWLFLRFGQDPVVAGLAQDYLIARLPSTLGFNLFLALRQYLAGRTLTRPAMWVMFLCNALNVFLNWVLIFGNLGAPALGLVGAGLATGITNVILPIGLFLWIRRFRLHEGAWRRWDARSFSFAGLKRYLALGFPVGAQLGLEANAFTVAMMMVGWMGVTELGAHQIVMNLASFTFMVPLGISIGASARAGNLIGAADAHGLRVACRVGFLMGGGVMAIAAVCFVVFREALPAFYTSEASVVAMAAILLPIAGAFQIFDGVQVVGAGLMRGMGRPQAGAVVNLIGFYAVGLPLSYGLAFPMGLGMVGIWWGLAAGLGGVAIMLVAWVARTNRKPLAALRVRVE